MVFLNPHKDLLRKTSYISPKSFWLLASTRLLLRSVVKINPLLISPLRFLTFTTFNFGLLNLSSHSKMCITTFLTFISKTFSHFFHFIGNNFVVFFLRNFFSFRWLLNFDFIFWIHHNFST